ncbi:MAG: glycosyltransferase [Bacteroidales bacterium]|nr:glycosyltransferase [Bacteroidales bacterium]
MKISLIISVYKNIPALKTILDALKLQSYRNFDIVISEDGEDPAMADFIASYPFEQAYQHLTQPDLGWRKNRALNAAIRAAKGDWLIFIDGDSVPHPRFVEMHRRYAKEGVFLGGKRVKLCQKQSEELMANPKDVLPKLSKKIFGLALFHNNRQERFLEEAFFLSPKGLWAWIPKIRKVHHLVGANMSMSKKALEAINGFNEDYQLPAIGEDIDLQWRLQGMGYKLRSLRSLAIQYHLWHKENWHDQSVNANIFEQERKAGRLVCRNGLQKLS